MENTVRVITSWITFSCQMENGPPFSIKPILLAGTWKQYSKKAKPQLNKIISGKPKLLNQLKSLSFRWPYQAKVMKMLEMISNIIVYTAFMQG